MNLKEENNELAKWLAEEMSETELSAFEKTPEYATYVKIATYSAQMKVPDFDADSLYQKIVNGRGNKSKVIPLYRSKWIKIAVVFVILLGLTFFFRNNITTTEIADNSKRTNFSLPDNSQITLNSGSEIDYKKWNWDNNRTLNLKGEAYFKVAHGKKFEVKTDIGSVTVMGTQFNVKARKKRLDVTCYQGKVRVNYDGKEVIITKGTSVTFDADFFQRLNCSVEKPEWTTDKIAFNKEKLQTIIDELQRQYDCKIVLNCKENNQLFTGIMPSNDIKTALGIVTSIFHLKISKFEDQKITLVDF